jgi:RHS repeat-associated protein
MRKDVDNNTYTRYYYDGLTVIAEYKKVGAGSWSWDKVMTIAPGVVGNILKIDNSVADDEYYHYDALGNVILTTLADTTPCYLFEQEAYGNVKVGSQSGYHLTTKEYDSFPELYYFWQRWYDPLLGRFLSTAPYPPQKEHPYNFALNSPSSYYDPRGTIVQVCVSDSFGIEGINHYFLHDTESGESCGTTWSSGGGEDPIIGHRDYPTDECYDIPNTDDECTRDCLMDYCHEHANDGIWFPFINDCRNAVYDAMEACGVTPPTGVPSRLGSSTPPTIPEWGEIIHF